MSEKQTHIAVLTGDIIGSTQLSPEDLERAFEALSISAEVQADWHGESLHFTRQRGDGWQVRLARPELALRTTLAFRAALRSEGKQFSTFMAVAEGDATPITPGADLNTAAETVFVESGRLLDWLKDQEKPIQIAHDQGGATGAALILADHISQGWTPAQAAAIRPLLIPDRKLYYTDVADFLGKSRQAVTKALDGAGFHSIWMALIAFEHEEAQND
ncbi:MarR family transcriptional regulator [Aliiroseovarius marinus]|uniref:MarR family transcriptional regulator n=1 Tax=Aliiroseovarius marinus TaxID=2500159 RepID=UPI003D7C4359